MNFSLTDRLSESAKKYIPALNNLTLLYGFLLVCYQCILLILPIKVIIYEYHLNILSYCLVGAGCILFALHFLFNNKIYRKLPYFLLFGILILMCLSALCNIRYGITDSIKTILWNGIQMLLLFPTAKLVSMKTAKKMLTVLQAVLSVFFVPAILYSLIQFCNMTSYFTEFDGSPMRQGFSEGRLFGVFSSAYFAPLFVALLFLISLFLAVTLKKKPLYVLYGAECVVFFIYIVLSGCRSVMLGLLLTVVVVSISLTTEKNAKKKFIKVLPVYILVIGISVGIYLGGYYGTKKAMDYIVIVKQAQIEETENEEAVTDEANKTENKSKIRIKDSEEELAEQLSRSDVNMSNISNNRFTIWSDYIKVVFSSVKNAVIGLSPGNYMDYIIKEFPDLYIVDYIISNYPGMYEDGLIYDTHNAYLSILVDTGIAGVLCFGCFLVLCAIKAAKALLSKKVKTSLTTVFLAAFVILILINGFFDSDLFFRCTDTSVLFWTFAGFLFKSISIDSDETVTESSGLTV